MPAEPRSSLTAATIAGLAFAASTAAVIGGTAIGAAYGTPYGDGLAFAFSGSLYGLVAVAILRNHPRHAVGWLLGLVGFLITTGFLAEQVLMTRLVHGIALPGLFMSAWYGQWYWLVMLWSIFVGLPLLFPSGQASSTGWRRFGRVAMVLAITEACIGMVTEQVVITFPDQPRLAFANPIGLLPLDGVEGNETVGFLFILPVFIGAVLATAHLVIRFRRSVGVERSQMKWGVFGVGATVGTFLLWRLVDVVFGVTFPISDAFSNAIAPLAMGLAITRYRLWDIDRVIGRTVAYVLVTLLLGGVYATIVLGSQALLGPEDAPDLVVAGATLLVAALFRPVRDRVQRAVDRRFDRAHYDGIELAAAFGQRLRDEVGLPEVIGHLEHAVTRSVAPTSVGVWLPPRVEVERA